MGEMCMRSRSRKDLAASFNRLKRMVDDIKSARKSLAAHHSFMAELVSVSLFSAVPSSKASSPRSPLYRLQPNDSREVRSESIPRGRPVPCSALLSRKAAASGPSIPSSNLQLDDLQEVGIGLPDDLLDHSVASLILPAPIPCSVSPTAGHTSSPVRLDAPMISVSPTLASPPSAWSGLSPLFCKNREEAECVNNKVFIPLRQQIAANPGKGTARPVYCACILFVFLCFFLFVGKGVAVAVTITASSVAVRGQSVLKRISRHLFPGHSAELRSQRKESMRLSRSMSALTHVNGTISSSSESHLCTRSQSLPMLHWRAQEEIHVSEPGLLIYSAPTLTSHSNACAHSARIKLGVMLVLALCGLAHGQIMAVGMCSCCILMFSEMQRLTSKRCKQEI